MTSYRKLRDLQPDGSKIFFAFSNQQFEEGLQKIHATKEEVVQGPYGVIGRREDVKEFLMFYVKIDRRIAKECNPQEVYEYEFWNHESAYTWDDTQAMQIVIDLFGKERCKREITSLLSYHRRYLFFNKRTRQWQHFTYGYPTAMCTAIFSEYYDIAANLGLDGRKDIGKVIALD